MKVIKLLFFIYIITLFSANANATNEFDPLVYKYLINNSSLHDAENLVNGTLSNEKYIFHNNKSISKCRKIGRLYLGIQLLQQSHYTKKEVFKKVQKILSLPTLSYKSFKTRLLLAKQITNSFEQTKNLCELNQNVTLLNIKLNCLEVEKVLKKISYLKHNLKQKSEIRLCLWSFKNNNVKRHSKKKREVESIESGDNDYVEYDYGDKINIKNDITESTTEIFHAHRHHHGVVKDYAPNGAPEIATENVSESIENNLNNVLKQDVTTTTENIKLTNSAPIIKNRLPKLALTSGKVFTFSIPNNIFFDEEDFFNLKIRFSDKNGNPVEENSWIQFDKIKNEVYGLPLEEHVSHWQFRLWATDSSNESVSEIIDIAVQQYKGHRSMHHEINLGVDIKKNFSKNVDSQIYIVNAIEENDASLFIVREIKQQNNSFSTISYFNESLPKEICPTDEQLKTITENLYVNLKKMEEFDIKYINYNLIGNCEKTSHILTQSTPLVPHKTKNFSPVPRNQVDRVNATIGQLLVYKVPPDTFYDPEDTTDLKLYLLSTDRTALNAKHWLQFDSKNQEFFGIPKGGDIGSEEYLLVAEDHEGLTATDALVVVVSQTPKKDFSVYFKAKLKIPYEKFDSRMQRKFIERVANLFNDPTTDLIQVRSISQSHDSDETIISFYNTTLFRHMNVCPEEQIEMVKNIWFSNGVNLRENAKNKIGHELNLYNIQMVTMASGSCQAMDFVSIHRDGVFKSDNTKNASSFNDDYILTYVLPAIIILAMIFLAFIIACVLHKRRMTGKMELGDEEERKSFRSKGIPVIFQDELDEKPEIGNKSPIILRDEKPPLLPPSYNSSNMEGNLVDPDCDEYVPPPAVIIGNKEIRGKSPVTPSYRKPPPYVSP